MINNYESQNEKSLGRSGTRLFTGLLEQGKKTFTLEDAGAITGLRNQSLSNFIYRLRKNGFATKIEAGLYNLVPLEMGRETEYFGNQYVVARELIRKKLKAEDPQYYFSHASAMEIHQMVTQPQFVVYATIPQQIVSKAIMGVEFRFISTEAKFLFGYKPYWITQDEMIYVSDLERTVIDGLKAPQYCGSLTEVAKGFWIKRKSMNMETLVAYAEKLGKGSVCGRLGYLLEIYGELNVSFEKRLQAKLGTSYSPLDPSMPRGGNHFSKWKLMLNIPEEEFLSTVRT